MKDLRQFFSYMNDINFPYVVLRNFENLPDNPVVGEHSDLDLLVYDREHWCEIFPMAERVHPEPRVQFKMPIGESFIYVDVRYVGDGYYPTDFEETILSTRERDENGFYIPAFTIFRLALAYHAVHHKGMNKYEKWLGDASLDDLFQALKQSDIGWSEPSDHTVGQHNKYWKGATSTVTKENGKIIKRQTSYKKFDLLENEYRILNGMSSIHFPKCSKLDDAIEIEDCGNDITVDNMPDNFREQMLEILTELKAYNVEHRDIKPDNFMIKDGIIKLIDFGWARLTTDKPDNPPSCLGYPYRPSWGIDDNFSMKKVIKQFEYQKEECLV